MDVNEKFVRYAELLEQWNARINLIGRGTVRSTALRHIADCRQAAEHLPSRARVTDLGSGAGLPAAVLAIARPDLIVTAVEADGRKSTFIRHVATELGLDNLTVLTTRIEELSFDSVDVLTARALAPLLDLLPHLQRATLHNRGAFGLFFKGRRFAEEIAEAQERYRFSCEALVSITEPEARLLRVEMLQ